MATIVRLKRALEAALGVPAQDILDAIANTHDDLSGFNKAAFLCGPINTS